MLIFLSQVSKTKVIFRSWTAHCSSLKEDCQVSMAKLTVHLIQLKQEKFAETTFSRLRLKVNWKRIFKHIFYIPPYERGFIINLLILDLFLFCFHYNFEWNFGGRCYYKFITKNKTLCIHLVIWVTHHGRLYSQLLGWCLFEVALLKQAMNVV